MVYFVEINKTEHEHEIVNGCLIGMLSNIYPGEVLYVGSEAHFRNLAFDRKGKVSTDFIQVHPPKDGDKLRWISKFLKESARLIQILNAAQKQKAELVFFSSLSVFANYVLSKIHPLRFKNLKVVSTLHGELELIKEQSGQSKAERLYGHIIKKALGHASANLKYLVLGESIREQVLKNKLLDRKQIFAIEHPYNFPEENSGLPVSGIPSFGHVGIAKRSKNSHRFFELADRFEREVAEQRARFALVGRKWTDISVQPDSPVEFTASIQFLDRATYLGRLESIHYAVFFYDDEHYGMTGSGAIMDAIAHNKPILCLRNSYFSNLFALTEQQPGWIFNTFEELCTKVAQIIDGSEQSSYALQVEALNAIKEKFTLPYLQQVLAQQLTHWER